MPTASLDYTLFRWVNGLAGHVGWLDHGAALFADWSPFVVAGLLVVLWFWDRGDERLRNRQAVLHAGAATVLALLVNLAITGVYFRDRPFLVHPAHLLVSGPGDSSFPSNHATAAFAIAIAVLLYNRRFGIVLLVLAALIAVDRVFVGIHYPGDVAAGALIGTGCALLLLPVRRAFLAATRVLNVAWTRIGLP
jgi:undecaprenyl-diphosphatase